MLVHALPHPLQAGGAGACATAQECHVQVSYVYKHGDIHVYCCSGSSRMRLEQCSVTMFPAPGWKIPKQQPGNENQHMVLAAAAVGNAVKGRVTTPAALHMTSCNFSVEQPRNVPSQQVLFTTAFIIHEGQLSAAHCVLEGAGVRGHLADSVHVSDTIISIPASATAGDSASCRGMAMHAMHCAFLDFRRMPEVFICIGTTQPFPMACTLAGELAEQVILTFKGREEYTTSTEVETTAMHTIVVVISAEPWTHTGGQEGTGVDLNVTRAVLTRVTMDGFLDGIKVRSPAASSFILAVPALPVY